MTFARGCGFNQPRVSAAASRPPCRGTLGRQGPHKRGSGRTRDRGAQGRRDDKKIPYAKRTYRSYFPDILEARTDQFVFEFANREMAEIEDWKGWAPEKLWLSPDCGTRRAVRYLAFGKPRAMVAGAKIVRHELMGRK